MPLDEQLQRLVPDQTEYEFLERTVAEFRALDATNPSLLSFLRRVASFFSELEIGIEETILSGQYYRYPSQIKKQRFCSEEALKNYLLCRFGGLNPVYAVVENYDGTGMGHEIILVPNGDHYIMLDWGEATPVRIEDNRIADRNGNAIFTISSISCLEEEQIIKRISSFQKKENIFPNLQNGQIVYMRYSSETLIDSYVTFDPETSEMEFLFVSTLLTANLPFYFSHRIRAHNGNITQAQEVGICTSYSRLVMERLPILTTTPNEGAQFEPFYDSLDEDQQWNVCTQVLYHHLIEYEAEHNGFYYDRERRLRVLDALLRQGGDDLQPAADMVNAQETAEFIFELKRKSALGPQRYLDFIRFEEDIPPGIGSDAETLHRYLRDMVPDIERRYFDINIRFITGFLTRSDALACHRKLFELYCERFDVPSTERPRFLLYLNGVGL